jgi:hypothetical protein
MCYNFFNIISDIITNIVYILKRASGYHDNNNSEKKISYVFK